MDKKMVVNTQLGILKYSEIVNEIANGYFDANGDYQPHFGLFNTMKVFYNECVKESRFDDEFTHDVIDPYDVEKIFTDTEFVETFNKAIVIECVCFDFANAFRDALDIVNTNKASINSAVRKLEKLIDGVVSTISNTITPENLEVVKKLGELLESGDFTVDKFIESYGDSKMFKELLASHKKDKVQ